MLAQAPPAPLASTLIATGDDRATATPRAWQRWLGVALSVAAAGFLIQQTAAIGWRQVWAVLPANPLFYLLFAAAYLALPLSELVIFGRLWPLRWPDLQLFLRKRVLNEALIGYSGEAYLYLWARRRPHLRVPALAAVKDVSITSALAGNVATLMLMAALMPFLATLEQSTPIDATLTRQLLAGMLVATALSLALLLFRGRLLSLPPRDNAIAFAIHLTRLLAGAALLGGAWALALPAIGWTVWLALGALRLIVSRLPLVPNKDLIFAGVGVSLAGTANVQIAALLAACAALTLVAHGLVLAFDALTRASRA